MSEYVIIKRMWLAQPRRQDGWKTHWNVVTVNNFDVTSLEAICPPAKFVGNGHQPYELYYHVSEVKMLLEKIKSLELYKSNYEAMNKVESECEL